MLQAVSEHVRAQQRLILATLALTRAAWDRMSLDDLDGSWQHVAPVVTAVVSHAQQGAAANAAAFVPAVLDEQPGKLAPAVAEIAPAGFAGWASDGRPLTSLLGWSVAHTRDAKSLDVGRNWLDMAIQTQIADVSRQATQVGAFTRKAPGYVRLAPPPCCQRCAVLAGKFSHAEEAFQRHPRCNCVNVPAKGAQSVPGYVIGADDVKDLTAAQRKAISDGADMNQVINSHRAGARSKDKMTTTEGVTRRGTAGKRLIAQGGTGPKNGRYYMSKRARLTPEGIYKVSASREETLRLLQQHGYII